MAYQRAHLTELGLSLWRPRGAAVAELEAATETPPPASRRPSRITEHAPPAQSDDEWAARIQGMDWEQLESCLRGLSRAGASQGVFGAGARSASLMVIGEAPGAQEDQRGEPFVGDAGQLLDRMLAAIGCSRERDVYIANVCKFRPPGNRDPRPDEIAQDLPFLLRQIELVAPRALLLLGRVAAHTLLARNEAIGRMRGQDFRFGPREVPAVVSYHPAYLLRTPAAKAKSWQDLKRLRPWLQAAQ